MKNVNMNITKVLQTEYQDVKSTVLDKIDQTNCIPSENLEKIITAYEEFFTSILSDLSFVNDQQVLNKILAPTFTETLYSLQDITSFCFQLHSYQERKMFQFSGSFLGALILFHYEKTKTTEEYFLVLDNLPNYLHLNAHDNISLKINGPIAGGFGSHSSNAKVTINGSCGNNLGNQMYDGTITVNGNVADYLGNQNIGGKLIVNGKAGHHIGRSMIENSAEIHLNGTYGGISRDFCAGKIYHNDKLIMCREFDETEDINPKMTYEYIDEEVKFSQ